MDWFQLERLLALAYRRLGYAVTRTGGANPDGGIDLVIENDGRRTAAQCKQWRACKVAVRNVREFLGALADSGIVRSIFDDEGYTADASDFAAKHGIEIMDGRGVEDLLHRSKAGEDPEAAGIVSDTRKLCPKCESEMVLRTATRGPGMGERFWGCSRFPRCQYKMAA